jgi:hypothetical protein
VTAPAEIQRFVNDAYARNYFLDFAGAANLMPLVAAIGDESAWIPARAGMTLAHRFPREFILRPHEVRTSGAGMIFCCYCGAVFAASGAYFSVIP